MDVEDKDGDDDTQSHKDHGEQQVLPNERDDQGRGRYGFSDNQQEHSEGQQDRNAQGDLLPTVWGQVEDQDSEEGDEEARDDEVDCVEEWQAADVEGVGDVGIDFLAAVVLDVVLVSRGVNDLPFSAFPEVFEIYLKGWYICPSIQIYLDLLTTR